MAPASTPSSKRASDESKTAERKRQRSLPGRLVWDPPDGLDDDRRLYLGPARTDSYEWLTRHQSELVAKRTAAAE